MKATAGRSAIGNAMTFFRAGTRLNLLLKSTLLVYFCLIQAQRIPATGSACYSRQCSCGMACCRTKAHHHAGHAQAEQCDHEQGTPPEDGCSISSGCCKSVPQAILTLAKAVLAGDFFLQKPVIDRQIISVQSIQALSGFPPSLLRPPLRYQV